MVLNLSVGVLETAPQTGGPLGQLDQVIGGLLGHSGDAGVAGLHAGTSPSQKLLGLGPLLSCLAGVLFQGLVGLDDRLHRANEGVDLLTDVRQPVVDVQFRQFVAVRFQEVLGPSTPLLTQFEVLLPPVQPLFGVRTGQRALGGDLFQCGQSLAPDAQGGQNRRQGPSAGIHPPSPRADRPVR